MRDRLICTASLCGLAPYDADGPDLDWFGDMVESNVTAYQNAAEYHLQALIATFIQQAERVRNNSQGLINTLRPELVGSDREVMGDVALRRIIAQTHAEALRESVDGWIDDVIALAHPWSVELSDITGPVLLWHGGDDMFIPASHTQWLHRQIGTSELRFKSGAAHFGAIKVSAGDSQLGAPPGDGGTRRVPPTGPQNGSGLITQNSRWLALASITSGWPAPSSSASSAMTCCRSAAGPLIPRWRRVSSRLARLRKVSGC